MRNRSFRDLVVWKQSMELVDEVYRVTLDFPRSEDYALKSQMRRAAVSIPSNIAEGSSRGSDKEQVQYLRIALGSLRELETQIEIGKRVGYISLEVESDLQLIVKSIGILLSRLISALSN